MCFQAMPKGQLAYVKCIAVSVLFTDKAFFAFGLIWNTEL